jgi:hypothetical protein
VNYNPLLHARCTPSRSEATSDDQANRRHGGRLGRVVSLLGHTAGPNATRHHESVSPLAMPPSLWLVAASGCGPVIVRVMSPIWAV